MALSLSYIFQLMIVGVINGSFYALNGVAWGIVYSTTRIFHFSHAFVFTAGAYAVVVSKMYLGLPLFVSFLSGLSVAGILGCVILLFIYQPAISAGSSQLGVFLAALGTNVVGTGLIYLLSGPDARPLYGFSEKLISVGSLNFTNLDVISVVAAWVSIALLGLFLARTKWGRQVQAVRSNPEMAEIIGINKAMIFVMVFAIGSVMGAIAAFFFTLKFAATPSIGFEPLLMAFIAVFLGGDRLWRQAFSGLAVGLVTALSLLGLASYYQISFMCLILFIFLYFKPRGLGTATETRG